jgi:Rab-GTPase-TBC domain
MSGNGKKGAIVLGAVGAVVAAAAYALTQLDDSVHSTSSSPSPTTTSSLSDRHTNKQQQRPRADSKHHSRVRNGVIRAGADIVSYFDSVSTFVRQNLDSVWNYPSRVATSSSASESAVVEEDLPQLLSGAFHEIIPYDAEAKGHCGYTPQLYDGIASLGGPDTPLSRVSRRIEYHVLEYLSIQDLCSCRGVNSTWGAFVATFRCDHQYLRACAHAGFSEHVRGRCWAFILGTPTVNARKREMYHTLLEEKSEVRDVILRDVDRTLIHHFSFNNDADAVQALTNVLHAYSVHDFEVGYCQAMNFIAAYMLTKLPEAEAYWSFYTLMSNRPHLRQLYLVGLPKLQLLQYQFLRLAEYYLPELMQHLEKHNISVNLYTTEWFMTIFTYRSMPPETVMRIWDHFLVDGWKMLLRLGLAVLALSKHSLLQLDFEQGVAYLKTFPDSGIFHTDVLLPRAFSFKVTNRLLHRLEQQYDAIRSATMQ